MTNAIALLAPALPVPLAAAPDSPGFERTAMHMASEFSAAMSDITHALATINAATRRLDAAFDDRPDEHYNRFGVDIEYHRKRCADAAELRRLMEREAWRKLVDALGIKNVMSVAKRKQFDEQLERGELPPVCEQTIVSILAGFAGQAGEFAAEAAREVFDILRPRGALSKKYATNSAFRVGRRVILSRKVELKYGGGFRLHYSNQQEFTAIDGVFHLLDGRGVMREHLGPLVRAIDASDGAGRAETEYFKARCFKNGNVHIEFKRLDLVKQLNGIAAGEYVLGEDVE